MSKNDHTRSSSATTGSKAAPTVLEDRFAPEPGDPMYSGEETKTVVKPDRRRLPGISDRSKRVAEFKHLVKMGLREKDPGLSSVELDAAADEAYGEFRKQPDHLEALRIFDETAPVSRSVRPSETIPDVEMAAMRWLPWSRGIELVLGWKKNRRGYAAKKTLAIAIFLQMAFGRERPEIAATYRSLVEENRPLRSWAHDYPGVEKARSTTYETVRNVVTRHGEANVVVLPLNIMMLRDLSRIHDAGAAWPRSRGRKKGERIMVGEIGIIDGTQIAAPVPQYFVKEKDPELKRILHGKGREMVAGVRHTDENGNTTKKNIGYLVVTIVDMATTLPFGTVFMPANGSEREAVALLLKAMFEVWPDCPMGTLVGDGLYQNKKELSHHLVFNWGIQPVFPTAKGDYKKELPYAETEGVPTCRCEGSPLMKMVDTTDFYTAERRARDGIPRGQEAPNLKARIRWECSNGKGGCGETASTRPFDEPRLYTFFPRQGLHVRATERKVLMWRRNAVESVFATLKNLGIGRDKFECPKWARDLTMEWLVTVGMLGIVARRMIHETGLYDQALAEARDLGLLTPATIKDPSPGPDKSAVLRAREKREAELDPPILPPGFEQFLEDAEAAEVVGA
jgi:hypothetical protein